MITVYDVYANYTKHIHHEEIRQVHATASVHGAKSVLVLRDGTCVHTSRDAEWVLLKIEEGEKR